MRNFFIAVAIFVSSGFFVLWVFPAAKKEAEVKETEEKSVRKFAHDKQVRLDMKDIIRPATTIYLGEGPFWITTDALLVDFEGYLWIRYNAWFYPTKIKEAPIEITPEVMGYSIKVKKSEFPMPVAKGGHAHFKKCGHIPVVKLTLE